MNRYVKEELFDVAMARRKKESLYEPLKELNEKKMESKAMKEYEKAKMSVGIHFAQIQMTELINEYRNGKMEMEQFKEQVSEVFNQLREGLDGLTHIDRFDKERAWDTFIQSIRKQLV